MARASNGTNGSTPPAAFGDRADVTPLTADEEQSLHRWLALIGETDPALVARMLEQCREDPEARRYFLGRATEVPTPDPAPAADPRDDRRCCTQCANLTARGLCLAAWRGEIAAGRKHEPIRDLPRRCAGYRPGPHDPDRRPGHQRWPGLDETRSTRHDD